jgi:hypothetical protein
LGVFVLATAALPAQAGLHDPEPVVIDAVQTSAKGAIGDAVRRRLAAVLGGDFGEQR